MGLKTTMNELSKTMRCSFRMNREIQTVEEKSENYKKISIVKDIVKRGLLDPRPTDEDIAKMVDEEFDTLNWQNPEQERLHKADALRQILRYLHDEKRTPIFPTPAELALWDLDVMVAPDFVFVDDTEKTIEVVNIKVKRPDVSQSADDVDYNWATKKSTNTVLAEKPLYALFAYGRDLVPADETYTVKASYYFLKKKTDNASKNEFNPSFFEPEGKNVVSISEEVTRHEDSSVDEGILDSIFKSQYEEYFTGGECSGEDCKTCDFYQMCNYKLAPKQFVKEKKVRSIKDLDLTESQENAINYLSGIARINAGAGAGKTLVVALRVVTLLLSGVKPEEICLLTFTNTGASEMLERIQLYNEDFGTGEDVSKIICTTFNAFGNDQIEKEFDKLGFLTPPTLIDDIERAAIIEDLLRKSPIKGLDYRNFRMNERNCKGALAICTKAFEIIKREELTLGDESKLKALLGTDIKFLSLTALTPMLELYQEYDMMLKQENLIEYADQEVLLFQILRDNPFYLEDMQIKHIIIDEFQDSSLGQIKLIKEFAECPSFQSLMVVGDDSQAIFSFRDTTPEYIINFDDIMGKPVDDFYLLENHRSTPEIIDFANKLNAYNENRIVKDLVSTREHGNKPVVRGFFSIQEEYDYIADSIAEKIQREDNPVKPEDIAFIASNKFELMKLGTMLTERNIPWVMLNPEPLLENSKVIAAINLAKAFAQPNATNSILIYLNALYENKLLEFSDEDINNLIKAVQDSIGETLMLPEKAKRTRFEDMLMDLDDDDEVYQYFLDNIKRRPHFEKELQYMKDFEIYGQGQCYKRCRDYPGVILTTAHSSKGLEWPIVYNSISKYYTREIKTNKKAIEEKRRLLFVSATRARDELYITGQYVAFGPKDDRTYNKFLKESYDIMGYEFNPIDPMEEIREAERKEAAKQRAAERRAKAKKSLAESAGISGLGMTERIPYVEKTETATKIKKEKEAAIKIRKELDETQSA